MKVWSINGSITFALGIAIPPSLIGILDYDYKLVVIISPNRLDKKKSKMLDSTLEKYMLIHSLCRACCKLAKAYLSIIETIADKAIIDSF